MPGPLAAVDAPQVDLRLTLGLGILVAIPSPIVAGPLFGSFITRRLELPTASPPVVANEAGVPGRRPGFAISVTILLLPVVFMLGKSIADLTLTE